MAGKCTTSKVLTRWRIERGQFSFAKKVIESKCTKVIAHASVYCALFKKSVSIGAIGAHK